MLTKYLEGDYDIANSFVIGDRSTDVVIAKPAAGAYLDAANGFAAAVQRDQNRKARAGISPERNDGDRLFGTDGRSGEVELSFGEESIAGRRLGGGSCVSAGRPVGRLGLRARGDR